MKRKTVKPLSQFIRPWTITTTVGGAMDGTLERPILLAHVYLGERAAPVVKRVAFDLANVFRRPARVYQPGQQANPTLHAHGMDGAELASWHLWSPTGERTLARGIGAPKAIALADLYAPASPEFVRRFAQLLANRTGLPVAFARNDTTRGRLPTLEEHQDDARTAQPQEENRRSGNPRELLPGEGKADERRLAGPPLVRLNKYAGFNKVLAWDEPGRRGEAKKYLFKAQAERARQALPDPAAFEVWQPVGRVVYLRAVAQNDNPRELLPGERVHVPYSGRSKRLTSELAKVIAETPEGVLVEVRRGKKIETHTFPADHVRRAPERGRSAHMARVTKTAERFDLNAMRARRRVELEKAAKALADRDCAEAKAHQFAPRHAAELPSPDYKRARAAMRRLEIQAEAHDKIARELEAFEPQQGDPFAINPRRRLSWSQHAGGTSAPEGVNGYTAEAAWGSYHVEPITTRGGRRDGYIVQVSTQFPHALPEGLFAHRGLWHQLGRARSPNEGKKIARDNYERGISLAAAQQGDSGDTVRRAIAAYDELLAELRLAGRAHRNPRAGRPGNDRDFAIDTIKKALKRRSGKAWSVTPGKGTAWGWIRITAPPSRRTWRHRLKAGLPDWPENYEGYDSGQPGGGMTPGQRGELAALLGLELSEVHSDGISLPGDSGASKWREEYMDRAHGKEPAVRGAIDYYANPRRRRPIPKAALDTFEMWHEFPPGGLEPIEGPPREIPATLVRLGDFKEVVYRSDKYTGKPVEYVHRFKKPYPVLATDPSGKHLHVVGGAYRITSDGLEG